MALTAPFFLHAFTIYPDACASVLVVTGLLAFVRSGEALAPCDRIDATLSRSRAPSCTASPSRACHGCTRDMRCSPRSWVRQSSAGSRSPGAGARRSPSSPYRLPERCRAGSRSSRSSTAPPNPAAPYGGYTQTSWTNVVPGLTGLLVDQQFGLFATAPVLVWSADRARGDAVAPVTGRGPHERSLGARRRDSAARDRAVCAGDLRLSDVVGRPQCTGAFSRAGGVAAGSTARGGVGPGTNRDLAVADAVGAVLERRRSRGRSWSPAAARWPSPPGPRLLPGRDGSRPSSTWAAVCRACIAVRLPVTLAQTATWVGLLALVWLVVRAVERARADGRPSFARCGRQSPRPSAIMIGAERVVADRGRVPASSRPRRRWRSINRAGETCALTGSARSSRCRDRSGFRADTTRAAVLSEPAAWTRRPDRWSPRSPALVAAAHCPPDAIDCACARDKTTIALTMTVGRTASPAFTFDLRSVSVGRWRPTRRLQSADAGHASPRAPARRRRRTADASSLEPLAVSPDVAADRRPADFAVGLRRRRRVLPRRRGISRADRILGAAGRRGHGGRAPARRARGARSSAAQRAHRQPRDARGRRTTPGVGSGPGRGTARDASAAGAEPRDGLANSGGTGSAARPIASRATATCGCSASGWRSSEPDHAHHVVALHLQLPEVEVDGVADVERSVAAHHADVVGEVERAVDVESRSSAPCSRLPRD